MRIYKYLHSCILIEDKGKKILIDPGTFSFIEKKITPEDFKGISAVLVTHAHADHADAEALKIILNNNPKAKVFSNSGVQDFLKPTKISVEIFEEGEQMIGGFKVEAVAAKHESILTAIPANTAYRINKTVVHPGDSMNDSIMKFQGSAVLALPIIASWTKQLLVAEFGLKMKPNTAIPIHDGFIKDFFQSRQNTLYKEHFSKFDIDYRPLGVGEYIER